MGMTNLGGYPVKNYLINSNFDIWQRNVTFSAANGYTADRWINVATGGTGTFTVTRQAFTIGQTDIPNEPDYFLRYDQTVAGSGTSIRYVEQRVEDVRTLAGKFANISFWIKSPNQTSARVLVRQSFGTGGSPSGQINAFDSTFVVGTGWTKISGTFLIPSVAGKVLGTNDDHFLGVVLLIANNAVQTFDIAQFQLSEGQTIQPWQLASGGLNNLQPEIALCQRYFRKSYNEEIVAGTAGALGSVNSMADSTTQVGGTVWGLPMRAVPTIIPYNLATGQINQIYRIIDGVGITVNAITGVAKGGFNSFNTAATTVVTHAWHYTAEADL